MVVAEEEEVVVAEVMAVVAAAASTPGSSPYSYLGTGGGLNPSSNYGSDGDIAISPLRLRGVSWGPAFWGVVAAQAEGIAFASLRSVAWSCLAPWHSIVLDV